MKSKIILRLLCTALCTSTLLVPAAARDIHVPGDLATLDDALKYAGRDDRIVMAPGQYHVVDEELVEGVTLIGDPADPGAVVLSAQGLGRVLVADRLEGVTLIGLTLTGGRADGELVYDQSGGALLVSESRVDLEHVHFVSNSAAASGGAVQVLWGELYADDCVFADNQAVDGGGAIDLRADSVAELERVWFESNTAAWGGGVSSRGGSRCWFNDARFHGNTAVTPQEIGGGVFADYSAVISFAGTVFASNAAREGGAVRLSDAVTTFTSCTVADNAASESGGAIKVRGGSIMLDRCILAGNEGASVSGDLAQLYVAATNIHGNSGGDWPSILEAFEGQNDNFSADPIFCGAPDYHLREDSPCAPENHTRGLIGALPVGCDNVAIELREFRARSHFAEVRLTWHVVADEPYVFRLRGRLAADPSTPAWDVPYQPDAEPDTYLAVDKPPRENGPITYLLEARGEVGDWFELGQVEVNPATGIPPQSLIVGKVYPNPFNPRVNIEFTLTEPLRIHGAIYDVQGRLVRTIVAEHLASGSHRFTWDGVDDDGRQQPTGTYLLKLSDGERQHTTKLVLVK